MTTPDNPFESACEQRKARLRSTYPGLAQCEVTLEDRPAHRYERKRFNVRLDLDYAGRQLVINREHDEDPLKALEQAFEAAYWKLEAARAARHLDR